MTKRRRTRIKREPQLERTSIEEKPRMRRMITVELEVGREGPRREGVEHIREEQIIKHGEEVEIPYRERERTQNQEEERGKVETHEGSEVNELVEVEKSPQHLEGDLTE